MPAASAKRVSLETKAGVIHSCVGKNSVKIKLTDPQDIKLNIPVKVSGRLLRVNFLNTGVPHAVVFVQGIDKINVGEIGRSIRYHKEFSPKGTNVNFVEVEGRNSIRIRTYERGVEDETLACGTGSTAAALIFSLMNNSNKLVRVKTQSGEVLNVYFEREKDKFNNVWLEGMAKIVYKGEYNV